MLDFGSVYYASCQEALRRLETLRRPGGKGVALDESGITRGGHEGLPADLEQALGLEALGKREGK